MSEEIKNTTAETSAEATAPAEEKTVAPVEEKTAPVEEKTVAPAVAEQTAPAVVEKKPEEKPEPVVQYYLPPQNYPLSPWAYIGLQILFSLPIIGFIFLIIFSISKKNINRRNFALSYFAWWLLGLIAVVVVILVLGGTIMGLLAGGEGCLLL